MSPRKARVDLLTKGTVSTAVEVYLLGRQLETANSAIFQLYSIRDRAVNVEKLQMTCKSLPPEVISLISR
jgi:hypothetical protein